MLETLRGTTSLVVRRYDADMVAYAVRKLDREPTSDLEFLRLRVKPYSITEDRGNQTLNNGLTAITNLMTGVANNTFSQTTARIGIGDSSTAVSVSQTDLQASSNKLWHILSGAVTAGSGALTLPATFGTAEANYTWNEFGFDLGTATVVTNAQPIM